MYGQQSTSGNFRETELSGRKNAGTDFSVDDAKKAASIMEKAINDAITNSGYNASSVTVKSNGDVIGFEFLCDGKKYEYSYTSGLKTR